MFHLENIGKFIEYKNLAIYDNTYHSGDKNIFLGRVRPQSEFIPAKSIFVSNVDVSPESDNEFTGTVHTRYIPIMITARGSKSNMKESYELAESIYDIFIRPNLVKTLVNYEKVSVTGEIIWAGYDDNDFPLHTINIRIMYNQNL